MSFLNPRQGRKARVSNRGKETPFINPRQGTKMSQNGRVSNRGKSCQQLTSRSKQFKCPTTLGDRKYKISNTDEQLMPSAISPLHRFFTDRQVSFAKYVCAYHKCLIVSF